MEYISAEEFLKQPMKVQQVIFEWWKPSDGDLFENDLIGGFGVITGEKKFKNGLIPLLTEGQLRKFIEDKYDCKMMVEYTICENIVIKLGKINKITGSFGFDRKFTCHKNKFDLLKAYWVVACEIAKGV